KTFLMGIVFAGLSYLPIQAQSTFDKVKEAVKNGQSDKDTANGKSNADLTGISREEMSVQKKEAINIGVKKGIARSGSEDGFFKYELVKILLPEKLRKVDAALRGVGLGNLADQGLLLLNRAAEDAVQEGVPIFANAITSMSFDDAKNILLGDSTAATDYLRG